MKIHHPTFSDPLLAGSPTISQNTLPNSASPILYHRPSPPYIPNPPMCDLSSLSIQSRNHPLTLGAADDVAPAPHSNYYLPLTDDVAEPSDRSNATVLNDGVNAFRIIHFTVGAGLQNLGNTCFFNVILQCLTHTAPLIDGLWNVNHHGACESGVDGFCVLCAFRDHFLLSLKSPGKTISPFKLVDNLNHFSSFFTRHQQEDAHEFLQCFLDKLERCYLDLRRNGKIRGYVDNMVEKIFGGRLISKLQCCNCGHCSDTYEPLIDFSLEIDNMDNLPSALASFTKVEQIDDKLTCDSCKEEVSMEKRLILDQTPSVAAFHLKRFKTDGTCVEKIDNHVAFPLELDLQPYTNCGESNNEALKYDLYALVVHIGTSPTSGHYFCFVRTAPDMWYNLDDYTVTRVTAECVLSQEAYILLYARKGTPWISTVVGPSVQYLDPSVLKTSPNSVLDNTDGLYHPDHSETDLTSGTANESLAPSLQMPIYSNGGFNEMLNDCMDSYIEDGQVHFESDQATVSSNCSKEETTNVQVPCNEQNGSLPSPDEKCHWEAIDKPDDVFRLLTPLSSPCSDSESPDITGNIPREHLKIENHERCKRPVNKIIDSSERKEAMRYLSKSGSKRSKQLMGAMSAGPAHDSHLIKKRKKLGSQCKKSIASGERKKSSSLMCASR